jgi:lipopolysaccharide transport system ATP-binding protein
VDEVLAVGDAAFQKRCLGKMNEVAQGGRTVVFVSHNLEAIQRLCSHAVMLDRGSVVAMGEAPAVIARYLATDYQRPAPGTRIDVSALPRAGTGAARFASVTFAAGTPDGRPCSNESIEFILEIDSNAKRPVRSLAVFLTDPFGTKVVNADTLHVGRTVLLERGANAIRLRIRTLHLMPGFYRVGLWLADPVHAQSVSGAFDYVESAFEIEVDRPSSATGAGTGGLVTCEFDVEELH